MYKVKIVQFITLCFFKARLDVSAENAFKPFSVGCILAFIFLQQKMCATYPSCTGFKLSVNFCPHPNTGGNLCWNFGKLQTCQIGM